MVRAHGFLGITKVASVMGTVKDYFFLHQRPAVTVTQTTELSSKTGNTKVRVRMYLDFSSGAIYLAFYMGKVPNPLGYILEAIHENVIQAVLSRCGGFIIQSAFPRSKELNASNLKFCGRIFIYSENSLSAEELATLEKIGTERGLSIEYFGPEWAKEVSVLEKPAAFISHDSRDKDLIA